MPNHNDQVTKAFNDCISRGATKQQLQDFINRAHKRFDGSQQILGITYPVDVEMLAVLGQLQSQI
ncbi:hypothetical protein BK138_16285 [Paenibacillus rhizosphaerae]|uniref:Uncharacterized protein n=1 Tax=Paenibacillus rhizosphaerae TaxID=297318 RepID=A0A1R1ESK1_9BACL|nr:hypothetical protein [Paenibacillus rhizosphaerae]OMF54712.1 hypothetical protein BK138_16285 [Paenibacillus rhizosphaerae]